MKSRKPVPRKLNRKAMKNTRGGGAALPTAKVVQQNQQAQPSGGKVIDCEGYTYLSQHL